MSRKASLEAAEGEQKSMTSKVGPKNDPYKWGEMGN